MILKEQRELSKIRKGDIRAFELLFHQHYQGLLAYAISLVKKEEIAEEAVQDVFYNIWKNREDLRINKSLQNYLYRASYNNCMMALRKTSREALLDEGLRDRLGGDNWDPLMELQYRETSRRIADTLEAMPEKTRTIFTLNRQEGLRYREIAEKLSISVKTVEAHMGKALKILKHEMEKG